MSDAVVIKEYNNRRLYDTEKNAYVTLAALSEIIKKAGRSRSSMLKRKRM